ncbi:MAG: hypothetical protein OEN23_01275 [Paracoccaceae bacterium]|nr:hypothetical protein [Paracoccaceae bacterium]
MRAFLAAIFVMALISVGADLYLETIGFSSAAIFSTENVRLGE